MMRAFGVQLKHASTCGKRGVKTPSKQRLSYSATMRNNPSPSLNTSQCEDTCKETRFLHFVRLQMSQGPPARMSIRQQPLLPSKKHRVCGSLPLGHTLTRPVTQLTDDLKDQTFRRVGFLKSTELRLGPWACFEDDRPFRWNPHQSMLQLMWIPDCRTSLVKLMSRSFLIKKTRGPRCFSPRVPQRPHIQSPLSSIWPRPC